MSREEDNVGDKVYTSVKNNLLCGINTANVAFGTPMTNDAPFINNFFWLMRGLTSPNGQGSNAGNYQYGSEATYHTGYPGDDSNKWSLVDYRALFRDAANGDYRPALSGQLLANLFPKVNTYDGTGVAYSASDVVGARSLNALAPAYPF
jgi:hypothetical protein